MERTSRPHTPITRRPKRNFVTRSRLYIETPFALISREPHNVRVDAAARIQSSIAGPVMMRNTLPPLASNEFVGHQFRVTKSFPVLDNVVDTIGPSIVAADEALVIMLLRQR